MAKVLSYKREDNKDGFVEKLYHALIAKGYDVWWDMQSMPMRQLTFLTEIRDAVASHDRLILVGSQLAYQSDYVKAEFDYALSICKPVHPILRADDYSDIPSSLAQFDAPDFRDDAKFDAAFDQLLRHLQADAAPLGKIHGTRPALPAWYIERDNIMDELDNMVMSDAKKPVVVTSKQQVNALHGMGGIGKTTVANAFSERCATQRYFPDGIFWVTLGKNPDITFNQANIGKIFGDDPKEYLSPEKGLARLQALLSDKRVLFVLDDVWEKEHADAFRIQGNFTRILITSRQQDLVTQIAALSAEVDKLTIEEGLRLFDARLVDAEGNPRKPENRNYQAIETQFIELLDGYTLAVELASAQLTKKEEDYAERLLDRLQKMDNSDNPFRSLKLEGNDKNANIELSLAISYEELSEDEQRRFRNLGVLAPDAPFPLELMQALWGDEDDEDSEDALDKLQNLALINRDENGLYEQHTILRAYALALLKRESEHEAQYYAYLQHITKLTEQFNQLPPEQWLKLDDVIPHVLYVGDTLVGTYSTNEKLAEITYQFVYFTARYTILRPEVNRLKWLEIGLVFAQNRNHKYGEGIFSNDLGIFYASKGNRQKALEYYKRALLLARQLGNIDAETAVLNNIGLAYDALGDRQQALQYYNQVLPLVRKTGRIDTITVTLNNIGLTYNALGDKQQALNYYSQALSLLQRTENINGKAAMLNNIGLTYDALGDMQQALNHYNQALPLIKQTGDLNNQATTLNNIGGTYDALGDRQQALQYYSQALPLVRKTGNISLHATTLNNIGLAHDLQGEKEKALHYYEQALSMRKQVGDKLGLATTLLNIGVIYSSHNPAKALIFYEQSLTIFRQVGDSFSEFVTLGNIAVVAMQTGDFEKAMTYMSHSISLGERVGHPDTQVYKNVLDKWQKDRDDQS